MIDIQEILKDPDYFDSNCKSRGVKLDIQELLHSHSERNRLLHQTQMLQKQQNEVALLMKQPHLDQSQRESLIAKGRALKVQLCEEELNLESAQKHYHTRLMRVPNKTHPDVPQGGEEDFCEIRRWKTATSFDFTPADHLALCKRHQLIDFEMGAATSGQKFYFLQNEAVFLELALIRYALDVAKRHGFRIVSTPDVAKNSIFEGIGFAPRGPESQIYSIEGHELSLIGTAEITIGGAYESTIFDAHTLPLLIAGVSHCFRTESGSHGRESKGLYRVHQFSKVELFSFCVPSESEAMHDRILAIEEEIFQGLEIPYRVIDIASGDLGAPAYRKFDIEAWMPGRGKAGGYGEVTSTSNCLDFQSRRLKIRYRQDSASPIQFVHTLNGTAVAIPRTIIAILENHQQADGSIQMPHVLQPYLPFKKIGS